MAERWGGGVLDTLGVTPQFIVQNATTAVSTGLNQGWKGAGQTFFTQAGSALVGNLASSAVNIGLNSLMGTQVAGASGLQLNSGANILASTVTPFVTSAIAGGINQQINKALQSAGPFGPILSGFATNAVNKATQSITNSIFGNTTQGLGGASSIFPGGGSSGSESKADYNGGGAYSNPKVVFSVRPANSGPSLEGTVQATNYPFSPTSVPLLQNAGSSGVSVADAYSTKVDLNLVDPKMASMYKFDPALMSKAAPLPFTTKELFGKDAIVPDLAPVAEGWTFICAPKEISWTTANAANRVDMFGTNGPPVVTGTKGMRDLSISEAIIEGFTRGVTVESKILALEKLMDYKLNSRSGFVDVPVYQIWANSKGYADSGYFVFKEVRLKEVLRDGKGYATRATVEMSFMQVPKHQVSSGRDQASEATSGASSPLKTATSSVAAQASQTTAARAGQVGSGAVAASTAAAKTAASTASIPTIPALGYDATRSFGPSFSSGDDDKLKAWGP